MGPSDPFYSHFLEGNLHRPCCYKCHYASEYRPADMTVGDYGYLLYDNDVKLNIIVGDIKADKDTDSDNLITVYSNCASEFIVDVDMLYEEWKYNGDVGVIRNEDNGEVSMVVGIGKY